MISFVMENTLFASFVRFRRANTFYFGGILLWHLPLSDSSTWPITDKVNREKIKEGKWNTFFFLISNRRNNRINDWKKQTGPFLLEPSFVLFALALYPHRGQLDCVCIYIYHLQDNTLEIKSGSGIEAEQNSKSEDCVAAGLNNGFTRNFSLPM